MKRILIPLAARVMKLSAGVGRGDEQAPGETPRTFAVETFVGRAHNYLDNMVDQDGLPYFNIFWCEPAEAAHDWPDFGDVMSR